MIPTMSLRHEGGMRKVIIVCEIDSLPKETIRDTRAVAHKRKTAIRILRRIIVLKY